MVTKQTTDDGHRSETMANEYEARGNTYPVRTQLSSLGCTYDKPRRRWLVPADAVGRVRAIRVPIGGQEELWEECSRCGNEPVDSSGLCSRCRGTRTLTVQPIRALDDEARELVGAGTNRPIASTLCSSRLIRHEPDIDLPGAAHQLCWNMSVCGGPQDSLLTDGHDLYTQTRVCHDGETHFYTHRVPIDKLSPLYRRACEMLIAEAAETGVE